MSNMIECGTCGYPLTPEERTSLVEHNGRMVKPWQGLTDEERQDIMEGMVNRTIEDHDVLFDVIEAKLKEKNYR